MTRTKTGIIAGILVAIVVLITTYEAQEIDGHEYAAVRKSFGEGTPPLRLAVARAMNDGKVTRWDYRGLMEIASQEQHPFIVVGGYANVAEERIILAAKAKQIRQ